MEKKIKRDDILYAHIQRVNHQWIKKQMKKFGFTSKRGKSEFLDTLFTEIRMKAGGIVATIIIVLALPLYAKTEPHHPRYQQIWDEDNKILATLDTKDGSIDFKADPKQVVKVVLNAYNQLAAQCQTPKEVPKEKK